MKEAFDWIVTEDTLRKEFSKITPDPVLVENAIALLREWFFNALYKSQINSLILHVNACQYKLLLDSFYQFIPFGTGGRRGRVGYGPNRISDVTVALSIQGHCNYLHNLQRDSSTKSVVVAYDVRVFNDIARTYAFLGNSHPLIGLSSRHLARIACEIYAGNGICAYLPDITSPTTFLSTPELSFLIRYLDAIGGVNISASHNHPDDNGFKFYTSEGAQDIPPADEALASVMNVVSTVRRMPFEDALQRRLIRTLTQETHKTYINLNLTLRSYPESISNYPVVFTPLCGTGDTTVGDVLRAAGYRVEVFTQQAQLDGTFSTVSSRLPNPEIPMAAYPAIKLAESVNASVVFSTDPDADRLGLYAKATNGSWRYITGNEIAAILVYYLTIDQKYGPQKRGIIIKTLVTTRLLGEIASAASCMIVPDLLVGFKYIAHVLSCLEHDGHYLNIKARPADLVIAAEESHGVLMTPDIRDKDAAGGALLLAELSSQLRNANVGLPDYFDALVVAYGNYTNATTSLVMRGISGSQALTSMMQSLRSEPFKAVGNLNVLSADDFLLAENGRGPLLGETDRMARNILLLRLPGLQVTIRPSGTEPKVKIYVDVEGRALGIYDNRHKVQQLADELVIKIADLCLARIGIVLSSSAKLLPDFVDLELKQEFGDGFRADLLSNAEKLASQPVGKRLEWLRERLAPFGAGADPLEVTAAALTHLCGALCNSGATPAQVDALTQLQIILTH
jgi:phosphoglucomutase